MKFLYLPLEWKSTSGVTLYKECYHQGSCIEGKTLIKSPCRIRILLYDMSAKNQISNDNVNVLLGSMNSFSISGSMK